MYYLTNTLTYQKRTPHCEEAVRIGILGGLAHNTQLEMPILMLIAGAKLYPCDDGVRREIPNSIRERALEFAQRQRIKLADGTEKTFAGWQDTGLDLPDYLHVGDSVDLDMVEHFRNVMPPLVDRFDLVQLSEPFADVLIHTAGQDSRLYKVAAPTYMTFKREAGSWKYAGICLRNQKDNVFEYVSTLDNVINRLKYERFLK